MKKTLLLVLLTAMLTACGSGNVTVQSPEEDHAAVTVETPQAEVGQASVVAVSAPQIKDWADAYAEVLLGRYVQVSTWGVTLMDIDRDGVPETVETLMTADSGGRVSGIFSYENGECEVWYDIETSEDRINEVFLVNPGSGVKCIATNFLALSGVLEMSVYELQKVESPHTYLAPVIISKTSCVWRPDDYAEELGEEVEAFYGAQSDLYTQTLAAVGERIETRTLHVELRDSDFTAETLAKRLREW